VENRAKAALASVATFWIGAALLIGLDAALPGRDSPRGREGQRRGS